MARTYHILLVYMFLFKLCSAVNITWQNLGVSFFSFFNNEELYILWIKSRTVKRRFKNNCAILGLSLISYTLGCSVPDFLRVCIYVCFRGCCYIYKVTYKAIFLIFQASDHVGLPVEINSGLVTIQQSEFEYLFPKIPIPKPLNGRIIPREIARNVTRALNEGPHFAWEEWMDYISITICPTEVIHWYDCVKFW